MLWLNSLLLLCGFLLLTVGADLLVRGAARLAALADVPALFVGLTVVAFGTSLPELAVALRSAAAGQSALAVGNVLGSNIANILLILGLGAVIAPVLISPQLLRREVPLMLLISAALWALSLDRQLSFGDGIVLMLIAGLWLLQSGVAALRDHRELTVATQRPLFVGPSVARDLLLIAVGLVAVIGGAELITANAVTVARSFAVSELFIGLTLLAVGTSLPEIATTVLAAVRGEREIAVGNIVGSNIINIGVVLALTAVTSGGIVLPPAALSFDLPVMTAAAFACLPIFLSGTMIGRPQGAFLLMYYVAYIGYLVIDAQRAPFKDQYLAALLYFVLPISLVTLVIAVRRLRRFTAD